MVQCTWTWHKCCRCLECYRQKFHLHLMNTVQIPGSKRYDTKMALSTATQNVDVSLALEF